MPVSKQSKMIEPYWQSECGRAVVYLGDCLEVMSAMEHNQFHAIVTDPPYGLEFMGKDWDAPWLKMEERKKRANSDSGSKNTSSEPYDRHAVVYIRDSRQYQDWFMQIAEETLRVAKFGAHLLSFGGTRMWHRTACGIEDAGWDIRDTIMWVYSSGFPKSMNVSKAIDKELGAERVEKEVKKRSAKLGGALHSTNVGPGGFGFGDEWGVSEPVTEAARQWDGWGTSLKPAFEPIVLARKPLPDGTNVAECVMNNGCGGLNIDGCRVGTTGNTVERKISNKISTGSGVYQFNSGDAGYVSMRGGFTVLQKDGRWPSNLIHDGSDEVVGTLPDGTARCFYTAKADSSDRPHGKGKDVTVHPTVKPLDLMQYLVRLVCAPGGTVLDPFMGSGSTGCAAIAEGMHFVGIEQSQEYADIAVGRLRLALIEAPPASELKTYEGWKKMMEQDAPPPPKRLE